MAPDPSRVEGRVLGGSERVGVGPPARHARVRGGHRHAEDGPPGWRDGNGERSVGRAHARTVKSAERGAGVSLRCARRFSQNGVAASIWTV